MLPIDGLPDDLLLSATERDIEMSGPQIPGIPEIADTLEGSIENTIPQPVIPKSPVMQPFVPGQEGPAPSVISEPIRGLRSADPPKGEHAWMGPHQPPLFGLGLRPSRAMARPPRTMFCERIQDRIEVGHCGECQEWVVEKGECSYVIKRFEEAEAETD